MPFKNQRSPSAPIVYGNISLDPTDGSVSADIGNFDQINLAGDSLGTTLTDIGTRIEAAEESVTNTPKLIKRMRISGSTAAFVGTTRLFSYTFTIKSSHSYMCFVPEFLIRTTVTATSANSYVAIRATVRTSDSRPDAEHQSRVGIPGTATFVPGMTFLVDRTTFAGPDVTATIYVDMLSSSGIPTTQVDQIGREVNFLVYDMGASGGSYSGLNLASVDGNTNEPTPDPVDPVVTTYTGTWYANNYATYSLNSGANQTSSYPGIIRQSTAEVPRIGMVGFNGTDQYSRTLSHLSNSNVSIVSAKVYIGAPYGGENVRWYYSSGGTGRLFWHGTKTGFPTNGTIPSRTFLGEITSWKNSSERSYDLSAILSRISNGTFGGVALSGEGRTGQNTYHGDFPYRARLVIKYRVTT